MLSIGQQKRCDLPAWQCSVTYIFANTWETAGICLGCFTHLPYSFYLALSDYHLFRTLQNSLHRKKFTNLDAIKNLLGQFLNHKPRTFWEKGILDLPKRWAKVIRQWYIYHLIKFVGFWTTHTFASLFYSKKRHELSDRSNTYQVIKYEIWQKSIKFNI